MIKVFSHLATRTNRSWRRVDENIGKRERERMLDEKIISTFIIVSRRRRGNSSLFTSPRLEKVDRRIRSCHVIFGSHDQRRGRSLLRRLSQRLFCPTSTDEKFLAMFTDQCDDHHEKNDDDEHEQHLPLRIDRGIVPRREGAEQATLIVHRACERWCKSAMIKRSQRLLRPDRI